MDSHTLTIIGITFAICALLGVCIWIAVDQMRSRRLRKHFGPEYDRMIRRTHDRNLAEAELQNREQRVKKYGIVPLSEHDRINYQRSWDQVQHRFVDDPSGATREADELIIGVMEKRGYPVKGFEQAAADLSVDHPFVVENYRSATAIAERNRRGEAGTEDLRHALIYYRALFHELLLASSSDVPHSASATATSGEQSRHTINNRGGVPHDVR